MNRSASPKLAAYTAVSASGLLAALVTGRPELVALTAPFLLALGVGLALAVPPRLAVSVELAEERALEGSEVGGWLVLESASAVDRLDLYLRLPEGLRLPPGANPVAVSLRAGERRELELRFDAYRYGGHVLGPTYVRARDPMGFLVWEAAYASQARLRVYPRSEVLRRIVRPRETQVFAGNEV
ncbi:MAG: hypothetical protein ACXVZ2_15465, partial [Gaiellaceae bacterium]